MNEVILLKVGEIVLKGLNRKKFEDILLKNIKKTLVDTGNFKVWSAQSTIYVKPINESSSITLAIDKLKKVFGIVSICRAYACNKDMNAINKSACIYLKDTLSYLKSFKIEAKRSDKKFPLKSPQICAELGKYILNEFPNLHVNVHNPDIVITVEIREKHAYVRGLAENGAGGLPVGTGSKAAVLISGGIDSPVAAWMTAKRGVKLTAIHFASPPYTSLRAEKKVVNLLKKVAEYSGHIKMITVPFTNIQESIKSNCKEELFTLIMRRFMMKISEIIAKDNDCISLVTGESLGQVASQTMQAISCTDESTSMPVLRPLICMDKDDIVKIARKIETFNISIEPYEDCCTVFTPKHPRTNPILQHIKNEESKLDYNDLVQEAVSNLKITQI